VRTLLSCPCTKIIQSLRRRVKHRPPKPNLRVPTSVMGRLGKATSVAVVASRNLQEDHLVVIVKGNLLLEDRKGPRATGVAAAAM